MNTARTAPLKQGSKFKLNPEGGDFLAFDRWATQIAVHWPDKVFVVRNSPKDHAEKGVLFFEQGVEDTEDDEPVAFYATLEQVQNHLTRV